MTVYSKKKKKKKKLEHFSHNEAFPLCSSKHLLLCANSTFFTTEIMNKCIKMGITAFKFVIWGGKLAVLQSEITFYGSANALP